MLLPKTPQKKKKISRFNIFLSNKGDFNKKKKKRSSILHWNFQLSSTCNAPRWWV